MKQPPIIKLSMPELNRLDNEMLTDIIMIIIILSSSSYSYSWKRGKYGHLTHNEKTYRINRNVFDKLTSIKELNPLSKSFKNVI